MKRTFMLPIMNFMTRLLEKISSIGFKISQIPIIFLIVFISSCAKDPGQIGYIIQPEDSKLNVAFSDTSTIYAYSKLIDSIRTDRLSVSAFGSTKDPVFGGTTAGFYTQFVPKYLDWNFGEEKQLDSLVLQLYYEGSYGDTNMTLTAHTYEMLRSLSDDSIYYSNLQLPLGPTDYSNFSFVPRPNDSSLIHGDTSISRPVLRINLTNQSTELGWKLLNADTTIMENTESLRAYFAGLFVQSEPIYEDGGMVYFGLSSEYSLLSLYYSNSEEDSLRFDYLITAATVTVNKYEHDYSSASIDFTAQVVNKDTLLGQSKFYAQGYGGVQSIVRIPNLNKWASMGDLAINEAKLILPGFDDDEFYGGPGQMSLLRILEDGSGVPLIDQGEGDSYFDGRYNESSNMYEFRITRYVQMLISDTTMPNRGLYLYVYGGFVHPERFIFKGNQMDSDSTGIKLELLYTDL